MTPNNHRVSVSLDAERIDPQTFVEVPFTVRNNTPDVLILDSFLVRDEFPGNVVVVRPPPWKRLVDGRELHTAFLMPGEELRESIAIKWLFAPDPYEETPRTIHGRLTYVTATVQEFEEGVVKLSFQSEEGAVPDTGPDAPQEGAGSCVSTPSPIDYWPRRWKSEEAFAKREVLIAPRLVPGPEWLDPWPEYRTFFGIAHCVTLGIWAFKVKGRCIATLENPLRSIALPADTDLSLLNYVDACEIARLYDPLRRAGSGQNPVGDAGMMSRLQVSRPVTPGPDWGDVWATGAERAGVNEEDVGEDRDKRIGTNRGLICGDCSGYVHTVDSETQGLVKTARDRLSAGESLAEVWQQAQDRLIYIMTLRLAKFWWRDNFQKDRDYTYLDLAALKWQLGKTAIALGVERSRIDSERFDTEMWKALGL